MSGVLATLRAASPMRRSVTTCVDGSLQAEWDALNNSLDAAVAADARGTSGGSLAKPRVTGLLDEMDAIGDRVAASEVTFDFERMDWEKRLALRAEHPPRDGNTLDRMRGFNTATFYRAEIAASCIAVTGADGDTVKGPDVPPDVWDGLLGTAAHDDQPATVGSLNLAQVNELIDAAEQVNIGRSAVPPSARSLHESPDSGASLAQPSPGTSPRDASAAGSPRGSRKSSATKKATSTRARSRAT